MTSPQLSLIGLSITTSPATSKSSSSCSSDAGSSSADSDPPAAYHVNLANLVPTLQLPPPLRGMQRLRATAQRQWVGHLDVIGILAKVVMRPRPQIHLGPIDHTASCVIVDLDLPDRPLVWASDSFCTMSGYALEDIIGRNPRFMQAPGGHVLTPSQRGSPPRSSPTSDHSKQTSRPSASTNSSSSSTETIQTSSSQQTDPKPELDPYIPPPSSHVPAGSPRAHTDQGTVQRIKAHLDANLEIQTTVLNYKRDGTPFWNWLSVVPVREAGEGSRFRYHVGIMADLVQQPKAIMRTMQAGFYIRTQA